MTRAAQVAATTPPDLWGGGEDTGGPLPRSCQGGRHEDAPGPVSGDVVLVVDVPAVAVHDHTAALAGEGGQAAGGHLGSVAKLVGVRRDAGHSGHTEVEGFQVQPHLGERWQRELEQES